jgi:hypothetical protein
MSALNSCTSAAIKQSAELDDNFVWPERTESLTQSPNNDLPNNPALEFASSID